MDSILPKHLQKAPHLKAFEDVLNDRFSNIDVSPCMMYMLDTCSPVALPFLAEQFGVLNYRDYQLAADDATRREVIKKGITTRSYMGTAWVIKQAMITFGFDPSWLTERSGSDPLRGWADFKLTVPAGFSGVDGFPAIGLTELIMQYKRASARFMGVDYVIDGISDSFPAGMEDVDLTVMTAQVDPFNTAGLKLDGTWKLDGSRKLHPGVENININVV